MESRDSSGLELLQLFANCYLQMCIAVHDKKDVPDVISRIQERCIGLRVKFEEIKLVAGQKNPDVVNIPDTVKDIAEAAVWMRDNVGLDSTKSLGAIGVKDSIIVLHINHALGDFKFGMELANDISQKEVAKIVSLDALPIDPAIYFENEIRSTPPAKYFCASDPNISRLLTKSKAQDATRYVQSLKFKVPISDIKYTDVSGLEHEKMFDSLMAAIAISTAALNPPQKEYKMGCAIPIDMRTVESKNKSYAEEYIKKKLTDDKTRNEILHKYVYTYFLSYVDAFTNASPNDKLSDVTSRITQSYKKSMDAHEYFGYYSLMNRMLAESFAMTENPDGAGIELLYNGVIKMSELIDDITLDTVVDGCVSCRWNSLISYVVQTPFRAELYAMFNYMPGDATDEEAAKFVNAIKICLTKLNSELTVSQAIEIVKGSI